MAYRRAKRAATFQGWIGLIALALWLSSLAVHAQDRLHPFQASPKQLCLALALPHPGPNANMGKIKQHQGPTLALGTGQAQLSEGETGKNGHGGPDLLTGQPAPLPNPGNPHKAVGYADPGASLGSGCPAGGNRPRPPPPGL
jgi:hypothetical protein